MSGQAITSGQGSITQGNAQVGLKSRKVGGGTGTQPLSGLATAMAMGLVSPGYAQALTGQASTGAQGGFTKSRTAALLGSAGVGAQGAVSTGPALSALSAAFTLTSPNTQTAPFSIGHAFKMGDVPAGLSVSISGATAQSVPKNYWPDGSLKFAIISGLAGLTANSPKTITLVAGSASSGTALTTADLKTAMSGQACTIDCGSFGAVSWATTDFDSPFQTWVSGAQMSNWIYRKPVGSDPHLVGWIDVRLFSNGAVEVLPWVENGYLNVAGPTNKSATYTFTLGSTVRCTATIDIPQHCRTPLVTGTAVSYWLGTDPAVTPQHNQTYMQATRLVPAYAAIVSPSAAVVSNLPTSWTPLTLGQQPPAMGSGGYDSSIGLLPEWDVLYLTTPSPKPYKGIQWNAYGAGCYGIHFRDETTNRPFKFSSYPHLVIDQSNTDISATGPSTTGTYTPPGSGTAAFSYGTSHAPSFGYMAYLVTGRWYFMEEIQFEATLNYLKTRDDSRSGWDLASGPPFPYLAGGVLQSNSGQMTTRGAAWSIRTLAQAWCATPDADSLKTEFLNSISANTKFWHAKYVAQPNNPLGLVHPYTHYNTDPALNVWFEAGWQHDFHSGAVGFLKALKPDLIAADQAKLDAFYAWHGNNIVGRFGAAGSTEWLFRDAAPYSIAICPARNADYNGGTGPWYSDFGAAYAATYAGHYDLVGQQTDGPWDSLGAKTLGDGSIRNANALYGAGGSPSDFDNSMPALAYAVLHGLSGAQTAYARLSTSPSYPALRAQWGSAPVWSVTPTPRPAWRQGMAQWEWKQFAGTGILAAVPARTANPGGDVVGGGVTGFNGMAANQSNGRIYFVACGGHQDYAGNECYELDLSVDAPGPFKLLIQPTAAGLVVGDQPTYLDGRPSSGHTYWATQVMLGKPFRFGNGSQWGSGSGSDVNVNSFNLGAGDWDAAGTWAGLMPSGVVTGTSRTCCKNEATGDVYLLLDTTGGPKLIKYDGATGARSDLGSPPNQFFYQSPSAVDTLRNRIVFFRSQASDANGMLYDIGAGTWTQFILSGFPSTLPLGAAVEYVPPLDRFVMKSYTVGETYTIHPTTWAYSVQGTSGSIPPDATNGAGARIWNRFRYLPTLGGFAYAPDGVNVYFLASE